MLPKAKIISISLIPTEEQVCEYMIEKMNWPRSFAEHYSYKFWNFYNSKGWKVGNQSMKDWKSCFNNQWQTIKYAEDEKKLTQCLKKEPRKVDEDIKEDKTISYLNAILSQYKAHPTWVEQSTLIPIYDHLKSINGFKLNSEQVQICRQMGPEKGKSQAVKFYFDKLIQRNEKF